jgi:2-polyprenyl-3-methyl-5-hydroxy-6-metoxy-1,4-benzoquinol methylase
MLARDWYYNQRRKIGIDSAVASLYDRHGDSDLHARAALAMLGVKPGWRVADIGCGNGLLACEAALMGAEVDAIDISPAMLALAQVEARDRKVAIRTQSAGLLSFAYQPESYDLIVSEFTLHHLPDFWKAVAMARIFAALKPGANFYLRDIVFVRTPDGSERDVEEWAEFSISNHDFNRDSVITHMRDEYSTFGWVIERMLMDAGFELVSADYHAPLHGTYLLRKPKHGEQADVMSSAIDGSTDRLPLPLAGEGWGGGLSFGCPHPPRISCAATSPASGRG